MEPQTLDFASTVDTSRPFRSVKEAVALFGERLLLGEIYSPAPVLSPAAVKPKRENSWRFTPSTATTKGEDDKGDHCYNDQNHNNSNNSNGFLETLRKLEAELEETKVELKRLKERESETEVALATLNAELHKNMSKLAQAEAAEAGKAAAKTVRFEERESYYKEDSNTNKNNNNGGIVREEEEQEEKKKRETLAQMLSVGEKESYYLGGKNRDRKMKKKMKPIIPLVGDLFSRKKGSPTNHPNPLFASPLFYN